MMTMMVLLLLLLYLYFYIQDKAILYLWGCGVRCGVRDSSVVVKSVDEYVFFSDSPPQLARPQAKTLNPHGCPSPSTTHLPLLDAQQSSPLERTPPPPPSPPKIRRKPRLLRTLSGWLAKMDPEGPAAPIDKGTRARPKQQAAERSLLRRGGLVLFDGQ